MSAGLISRSPDLQRLQREGYSVEVRHRTGVHLLIHDVPYLNAAGTILRGTLVSPLELLDQQRTKAPSNHQTWFIGDHPCTIDGRPIPGIVHSSARSDFGDGIQVDHSFSTKPREGYPDYYAKMSHYLEVISAPARSLDPNLRVRVHRPILTTDDSVFLYADTASTRAGIGAVAEKVANLRIAIVGLGGTGSFIADMVAKTHVRELHLYDGDVFYTHNAFRAPGATSATELESNEYKALRYQRIHSVMRRGVVAHPVFVTDANVHELSDYDFVFICVDRGPARALIAQFLLAHQVPFIDVGMHVQLAKSSGTLFGQVRTTLCTPDKHDHFDRRVPVEAEPAENDYDTNIQVVELNALNAVFAVIRWKKLFGIFDDQMHEHESVYAINTQALTKDERT